VGATDGVIEGGGCGGVAPSVGGGTVAGMGDVVVAGAALAVGAAMVDGGTESVGVVGDPQAAATNSVSRIAGCNLPRDTRGG
jgi:hypothetical protein